MQPDVSVIVVNFHKGELTVKALQCAERAAGNLTLEEIVVNAEPNEDDLALLRAHRPQARIVELPANPGFAASNNAGIAVARGRLLLFLNSDAFAEGDSLLRLVEHLDRNTRTGLVAPLVLCADGSPQDNAHRRFPNLLTLFVDFCTPLAFLLRGTRLDPHHTPRAHLTGPTKIAHANGAVMLARAEAAVATGPWDEGFFLYLEETEWQRRMAEAGWEREILPDARFTHLGGGSSKGMALASDYYLASIRHYYERPRLAFAVVRTAGIVSRACVAIAIALGFRSQRMRNLERGFGELRARLHDA